MPLGQREILEWVDGIRTSAETEELIALTARELSRTQRDSSGAIDGSYLEYQAEKKQHVGQTLKRHFLNHNGENPLQAYNPASAQVRPAHGPIPDPAYWFHAESVLWGTITAVASGTFIPIPVDSILAWGSDGGFGEFAGTFVGDFETDDSGPPAPRKFRVKNR